MARDLLAPQQSQPRDLLAPAQPEVKPEPNMPDWQKRTRAGMQRISGTPAAVAETAAALATGAAAAPVSGLAGLVGTMLPGEQGQGARWQEATQDALTYAPRRDDSRSLLEAVAKPFEAIERGADYLGEVSGTPEQALGATAVKTALLAAPMALGIRTPKVPAKPQLPKSAPTTKELKGTAKKAYKAADDSGVIISKDSFGKFVDDLQKKLADEAIDKDLTPKAMKSLERLIERKDENFSMKGAEVERRAIKAAEKSIDPADKRMAGIIRREFDDYLEGLDVKDVVAGDAKAATASLKSARAAWTKAKKSEVIQDLMYKAELDKSKFTRSGYENSLRDNFKRLAKNEKKMRMFTEAEQAAIRKVVQGGPAANAMRMLGKLAPRGVISGGVSGGVGYAMGGPVGAAAMMGVGELGRFGATRMTSRNAKLAEEMMRRGGPAPKTQPTLPVPDKKSMALAAELASER